MRVAIGPCFSPHTCASASPRTEEGGELGKRIPKRGESCEFCFISYRLFISLLLSCLFV